MVHVPSLPVEHVVCCFNLQPTSDEEKDVLDLKHGGQARS